MTFSSRWSVGIVCFLAMNVMGCHWGLLGVAVGSATSHGPYRANELVTELGPGSVRTLGCLDVGMEVKERHTGEHLIVHVGNRCGHPEAIDLRRAEITGLGDDGHPVELSLFDPHNEVVELHVGAAEHGREIFRLVKNRGRRLYRVCFDLKRVAPDAADARPDPFCLVREIHENPPAYYTFKAEGP